MSTQVQDADEESRYIVRVAIRSNAETPSEAAQDFAEHVMIHGFASVTFNVEDVISGTDFIATLSDYGTADDVLAALNEDEDEGEWWIERIAPTDRLSVDTFGPFMDEDEALEYMRSTDHPLDPDLHVIAHRPFGDAPSEGDVTPAPADRRVLVKGVCGRCGDLADVMSGEGGELDGKCLACIEDARGVDA